MNILKIYRIIDFKTDIDKTTELIYVQEEHKQNKKRKTENQKTCTLATDIVSLASFRHLQQLKP